MTSPTIAVPKSFHVGAGANHPHVLRVLERALTPVPIATDSALSVTLAEEAGLREGAFSISAEGGPASASVRVAASGVPGFIYAAQEVVKWVRRDGRLPVHLSVSPALEYRVVWTWDHSTAWNVTDTGIQDTGAFNPYLRQPEVFLDDYFRLIDFLSDNRVAALVVYGLLRSGHGGVESAQEVCRYAKERGVRLLPGIAINAYGGFFYEGEHKFNLATWLRKHPELAMPSIGMSGFAIGDYGYVPFPRGDYSVAADPSRSANREWHLEGIDWILEALDVGGLNIEFGDYAGNDLLDDMRRLLPGVLERARNLDPDGWLMSELGPDHVVEPGTPDLVDGLPSDCVYQYTYNKSYWPRLASRLSPELVGQLPTNLNVVRAQTGTQWNRQRHSLVAEHFLAGTAIGVRSGLDGFSIFTEASDYHPTNELNYIAYARGAFEGDIGWDRFLREEVEPRLGDGEAAGTFVELAEGLDSQSRDLAWLQRAGDVARHHSHGLDGEPYRRWLWLEERLSRHAFNVERMRHG